jgi:hypothetical protein
MPANPRPTPRTAFRACYARGQLPPRRGPACRKLTSGRGRRQDLGSGALRFGETFVPGPAEVDVVELQHPAASGHEEGVGEPSAKRTDDDLRRGNAATCSAKLSAPGTITSKPRGASAARSASSLAMRCFASRHEQPPRCAWRCGAFETEAAANSANVGPVVVLGVLDHDLTKARWIGLVDESAKAWCALGTTSSLTSQSNGVDVGNTAEAGMPTARSESGMKRGAFPRRR